MVAPPGNCPLRRQDGYAGLATLSRSHTINHESSRAYTMYKEFFGLRANPFNVNPDPRYSS